MTIAAVLLLLLLVFGLFVATSAFKIIGQAEVMVIERLGRFHRIAHSGFNVLMPFLERPRAIDVRYLEADVAGAKKMISRTTTRIDLREQVLNFPSQPVITKDNVTIDIDAVLYYRIADPQKATYAIQNLPYALETLTKTTLRNIVGDIELDQTLASRDMINSRMREVIEEAAIGWGVDVTRVELQAIEPPRDIQQSMELQMRAERERPGRGDQREASKRAQILEAEGARESQVRRAEGEKEAAILRAQGRRGAPGHGAGRGRGHPARGRRAPRGRGVDVPVGPQVHGRAAQHRPGARDHALPPVRGERRARRDGRAALGAGRGRGRRPRRPRRAARRARHLGRSGGGRPHARGRRAPATPRPAGARPERAHALAARSHGLDAARAGRRALVVLSRPTAAPDEPARPRAAAAPT
jgi:regulator of protease activity HflC (stomatin/prohibitin superfamily)